MIVLPYAIIVSMIAYCINRKINVSNKKQIKTKKILGMLFFFLLLFCICDAAVLLEYRSNKREIFRFTTEKIIHVKNHYIIGKGIFITLFLTLVTGIYNYFEAKIRAKKLAKEAEKVNYEIDNEPEEKPFVEKYHLLDVFCYVTLSTITYMITSAQFIKFVPFLVKTYVRL